MLIPGSDILTLRLQTLIGTGLTEWEDTPTGVPDHPTRTLPLCLPFHPSNHLRILSTQPRNDCHLFFRYPIQGRVSTMGTALFRFINKWSVRNGATRNCCGTYLLLPQVQIPSEFWGPRITCKPRNFFRTYSRTIASSRQDSVELQRDNRRLEVTGTRSKDKVQDQGMTNLLLLLLIYTLEFSVCCIVFAYLLIKVYFSFKYSPPKIRR